MSEDERAKVRNAEAVITTDHRGIRYFCTLPRSAAGAAAGAGADAGEEARAGSSSSIGELLDDLKNQCFYRIEGWWTYEFCHGKGIRQYHQDDNQVVTATFSLGAFDAAATRAAHDARGEVAAATSAGSGGEATAPYHAHVFTGGTPCDLTDLERETEVRFTCARQSAGGGVGVESGDAEREKLNAADANVNAIERIDEASTCRYTMTFTTPSLCAHDAFRTKEQVVRDIVCRRFDAEGGEEEEARGGSGGSGGDDVEEDAEAVFSRRGADGEL